MKDAKIAGGVIFLGGRCLRGIFHDVKLFHLRREEARPTQSHAQADDEDDEGGLGEEFAGIEPIEDQMHQRDGCAPLLEDHIAFDEDLSDGARHPFSATYDLFDLRAEDSGPDNRGEKDHRAQPYRRVEQSDKSEYRGHWPRL